MELRVDPQRCVYEGATGVYVRALGVSGRWESVDIATLDDESLALWAGAIRSESVARVLVGRIRDYAVAGGVLVE